MARLRAQADPARHKQIGYRNRFAEETYKN